jgi:hypothetical protein
VLDVGEWYRTDRIRPGKEPITHCIGWVGPRAGLDFLGKRFFSHTEIRGGVVVKALRYKPAGRGFDYR